MLLQPGMNLFPHTLASGLVLEISNEVGLMNSVIVVWPYCCFKKNNNTILQRTK